MAVSFVPASQRSYFRKKSVIQLVNNPIVVPDGSYITLPSIDLVREVNDGMEQLWSCAVCVDVTLDVAKTATKLYYNTQLDVGGGFVFNALSDESQNLTASPATSQQFLIGNPNSGLFTEKFTLLLKTDGTGVTLKKAVVILGDVPFFNLPA